LDPKMKLNKITIEIVNKKIPIFIGSQLDCSYFLVLSKKGLFLFVISFSSYLS